MSSCGQSEEDGKVAPDAPKTATVRAPCAHTGCEERARVYTRQRARCREHFLAEVRKRFLGHLFTTSPGARRHRTRLFSHDDGLLLAYSGGVNSRYALHMAHETVAERTVDPRLRLVVAHIDESALSRAESSHAPSSTARERIRDESSHYADAHWRIEALASVLGEPEDDLRASLSALGAAERSAAQVALRWRALARLAAQESCCAVILGTNADQVATEVLTGIARGNGYALKQQLQHVVEFRGVRFITPMRDIEAKEVACAARLLGLSLADWTPSASLLNGRDAARDVGRVTKGFLTRLQQDFPSTVHAVNRTLDKLGVPPSAGQHECAVCGFSIAPADVCDSLSHDEAAELIDGGADDHTRAILGSHVCYRCRRSAAAWSQHGGRDAPRISRIAALLAEVSLDGDADGEVDGGRAG